MANPPAGRPPDFESAHKRAAEIVEKDTMLAYAVATELRKKLRGYTKATARHELMSRLVYGTWNTLSDIEIRKNDPRHMHHVLELITDTLIIGFDILTEQITSVPYPPRTP